MPLTTVRRLAALAAALCTLTTTAPAFADVDRVEVLERVPLAGAKAFGNVGAYERIRGRLYLAIDANAPADEIKSKLANYRTAMKAKEAKLEKAQADLRQILSTKQEAAAVLMGLLK
jgi:hypothetical protein